MQKIYKAAIIGGGASGLMCAVELLSGKGAFRGSDVIILERNDRLGKKLVATGNGQGNFSNLNLSPNHYYGDSSFAESFFMNSAVDVPRYFYNIGIPLEADSDGKIYPLSKQASSALDLIRAFLQSNNCNINLSVLVREVKFSDGVFSLYVSDGAVVYAENVILAAGGCVAKQFGTDGYSYRIAENFGHTKTKLSPSLVQVKTETGSIKGLKGIKEKAGVTLFDDNRKISYFVGDLLFTDYGVSGNSIFALSARIDNTLRNPYFEIDFIPEKTLKELTELLEFRASKRYIGKEDIFTGIINKKTGQAIIKNAPDRSVDTLARLAKAFKLKIVGTLGFDYAQVTKGGIDTKDVNPRTMESKLQKSLYLVGEIVNVDGDCGGYNLAFAFSSGIVAARAVKADN